MPIRNYDDCRLLWKSCRFPAKGKPLGMSGARLFKEADMFVVRCWRENIATITPDSVLVMHIKPEGFTQGLLYRLFNLRPKYVSKGRYRMGWSDTPLQDGELPEVFVGVRFNMFTHQCLNASDLPAAPLRVKHADKEREWQRKLRQYVRGWKVREKIGALVNEVDTHMPELVKQRANWDAATMVWCIENEVYGDTVAKIILEDVGWYYAKEIAAKGWSDYIEGRHRWETAEYRAQKNSLIKMFERVYRRNRDGIYNHLGITSYEYAAA